MRAPARRGLWLPGARLGALICLFVVACYGALLAARIEHPRLAAQRTADEEDSRARRRAERRQRLIQRIFERILPERLEAPPASDLHTPVRWHAAQAADPVAVVVVENDLPAALSAEPAAFRWPKASVPVAPGLAPPFETAAALDFMPTSVVDAWLENGRTNLVMDIMDDVFRVPEALLDGAAAMLGRLAPRPSGDGDSLTSRILDFEVERRDRRPAAEFFEIWLSREARYFAKFDESRASATLDEEPDGDAMRRDQQKILWEAFRKTYFSRYRRAEEKIRDDAFSVRHWRGIDYAVVPPLLAGYLWFRGLDRKFSFGPTSVRVDLEPLSELASGDEVSAFGVEWMPKGSPVGLLFSVGVYDGDAKVDFIGIGTSIGMARKALALHRLEGDHRE